MVIVNRDNKLGEIMERMGFCSSSDFMDIGNIDICLIKALIE